MGGLNKKQTELLQFLTKYQKDYGKAPTLKIIADKYKISIPAAHMRLRTLILKGYISRGHNTGRSIVIKNNIDQKSATLPILGVISAGDGIEVFEESDPEMIEVPPTMVNSYTSHYCLRVKGNSMIDEGIMDGDHIIVRSQSTANNGDVVVAIIKDGETELANLKKYYIKGNAIELQPRNPTLSAKRYRFDQIEIRGKFCGLLRK